MNDQPQDQDQQVPLKLPDLKFGDRPRPIVPQTLEDAWRYAQLVLRAKSNPDGPEGMTVAMLFGAELGISALTSAYRVAIINGKPTLPGEIMLSVVRARGLLEEFEEGVDGEGDDRRGFCTVKRKGDQKTYTSQFSVKDAKQAGLWDERDAIRRKAKYDGWVNGKQVKKGDWIEIQNDNPWHTYADRMLVMRARGFRFRDSFGDVLGGFSLPEEMMGPLIEGEAIVDRSGDYTLSRGASPRERPPVQEDEPPVPPEPPLGGRVGSTVTEPPTAIDVVILENAYRERANAATSEAELDATWNEILGAVEEDLPEDVLVRFLQMDDEARQRLHENAAMTGQAGA